MTATVADRTAARIAPLGAGDLSALVRFLVAVYPSLRGQETLATQFYAWKYFDLAGRATGYPAGFLARDEMGVVGFIGCLPFTLRVGDEWRPAGWIADWRLAERARGHGLGRALLRQAMDVLPVLGCVDGSDDAERLYRESGFAEWPCARAWMQVRHPVVFEWPRRAAWRRPLGLARALGHAAYRLRHPGGRADRRWRLEPATPDAVDEVNGMTFDGMVRDAAHLRWVARCPVADLQWWRVTADGAVVGLLCLQRDRDAYGRRRGRVLELLLQPDTDATEAYRLAAEALGEAGSDYIEVVASEPGRAPAAAGYAPRAARRLWLYGARVRAGYVPHWQLSLLDKDDAFRGAGVVP